MKHYAFIPARGGSKGLPRKNFLELAGRPVLDYTILAAKASGIFERVVVVSEDDQAKDRAKVNGLDFIAEPLEMAGDFVSSTTPVIWAAGELGLADTDVVWNLQPTSPLRQPTDIVAAKNILEPDSPENVRFVTSVTPIDPHYFHWALKLEDRQAKLWFPDFLVERNLLPPVFRPNGAIKAGFLGALREEGSVFAEGLSTITMPDARAVHIRDKWDMELVQLYLEKYPEEFEWVSQ